MMRKRILGIIAFVAVGEGLILSAAFKEKNFFSIEILVIIAFFFMISLLDHIYELIAGEGKNGK